MKFKQFLNNNKKYINIILNIIIVSFLMFYLSKINWEELRKVKISIPLLIISVSLDLLSKLIGNMNWLVIVQDFYEGKIRFFEANLVYAKSWLGRYVPGKVTWVLGKVYFTVQLGLSKFDASISSFFELFFQLSSTAVLGLVFLVVFKRTINSNLAILLVFLILVGSTVIFSSQRLGKYILTSIYKLYRKNSDSINSFNISSINLLKYLLIYTVWGLINGLSFFFITWSVIGEIDFNNILYFIGVSNISGVIGVLAIFSPSGFGVREMSIAFFLKDIMPSEAVVLSVTFSRLMMVLDDILYWLVSYGINRVLLKIKCR